MKKNVQLSRKLLEFLELLQTLVTFSMHQLNESDRKLQSCRKEHEMTKGRPQLKKSQKFQLLAEIF